VPRIQILQQMENVALEEKERPVKGLASGYVVHAKATVVLMMTTVVKAGEFVL